MFEHKRHRLLSAPEFSARLVKSLLGALCVTLFSLAAGMAGYRRFEGMGWTDAFLNASMIMSGEGPVGSLHSRRGKLFAGLYALYCGLALMVSVGILAAPLIHRFLHRFHMEESPEP